MEQELSKKASIKGGQNEPLVMQREIKFRAWDKTGEMMHEVGAIHYGLECVEVYEPDKELDFNEIELMQYTGLKDNSDIKEDDCKYIYEGDIIKNIATNKIGVVIYSTKDASFKIHLTTGLLTDIRTIHRLVVIGNVFENPELVA